MAIITLAADSLTAANPYIIGSAPDNLTGYSVPGAANQGKIYGAPKVWSMASGSNATWRCDTALTSSVIAAKIKLPNPVSSNTVCVALMDASNNGLLVITGTTSNNFRIFAVSNGVLSGSALRTDSVLPIADAVIEFRRTISGANHDYEIFQNGSKIGATYNNNTYNATYGACMSRGGDISEFSVEYIPAQTVDSINSGSDITSGQTSIPFTTTGFISNTITAITTNRTGVTCSAISNSGGGAGTFSLSDFSDGVAYPALPSTVTYTFTDGTNTAQITEGLILKSGWSQVTYASAIPLNDRVFCWWLDQAGVSISDGTMVYWPTTSGLAFLSNGDTSSDSERTITAFVRDISTGLMSEWVVTINDAGVVINAGGLSVAGLSNSGRSNSGLSVTGL